MFDKKDIDSYRSISAPNELRERVMTYFKEESNAKTAKKYRIPEIYKFSAMAVCMLLVLVIGILFYSNNNSKLSVWVNGEKLTSEAITISSSDDGIAPANARAMLGFDIPIEFDIKRQTEISVSGGMMQVFDEETGELIALETTFFTDKSVKIVWEISTADINAAYEMYVSDAKDSYTITPKYDHSANCWKIGIH